MRKQLIIEDIEWNLIDRGEGPPILLVHGFPLDHSMWSAQVDALSERFRVVCPDLPGYGRSRIIGNRDSTSMEEMADELAQLLSVLGISQVAFCGLSMGGYIGWQFWLRHRERLSHLVACDTRIVADTDEVARGRRILARGVREHGAGRVASVMIPKLFAATTLRENGAVVSATKRVIAETSPATISSGHLAMADRPDMSEYLEEMGTPSVLVVVGEFDSITPPAEMSGMARKIRNSTYVEIRGAGHLAPLEEPESFNRALIDFLESQALSQDIPQRLPE